MLTPSLDELGAAGRTTSTLCAPCPPAPAKAAPGGERGGGSGQSTSREGARTTSGLHNPSRRGKWSAWPGEAGWRGFPFLGSDTMNVQKRHTMPIHQEKWKHIPKANQRARHYLCLCLPSIGGGRRQRAEPRTGCGHSRSDHGHVQLCGRIWSPDLSDLAGESRGQGDGKGGESPS